MKCNTPAAIAIAFQLLISFHIAVAGTVVPGTIPHPIGEDIPKYPSDSTRRVVSLSGDWQLTAMPRPAPTLHLNDVLVPVFAQLNPETTVTLTVQVPGVWQTQGLGMNYHTGAQYQTTFTAPSHQENERVWLCFSRVATRASVELNGQPIGQHTGAWTAFEFDVTEALKDSNNLRILVDELPEHWTAGFLRNVISAFGGIWGDVWLEVRPATFIHDAYAQLSEDGDHINTFVEVFAHDSKFAAGHQLELTIGDRRTALPLQNSDGISTYTLSVSSHGLDRWSPSNPALHNAQYRIVAGNETIDVINQNIGLRSFSAEGDSLRINGAPIYWAGVLHWGVYPELMTPNRTSDQFREELRALKQQGFNAVNICLFVFPKRYYEIADEEGVMLWQEYPLWLYWPGSMRPNTAEQKEALVAEYIEMFRHVRPYPSVVLHSLAVEDPEADLDLMKRLFHLCHDVIPQSVVQDNSAFLNQKVADFLDHHPYDEHEGYRHRMGEWMKTVHGRGKQLLLFGEAMDFDTLRNTRAIIDESNPRPWWTIEEYCRSMMIPANANDFWGHERKLAALEQELGPGSIEWIKETSRAKAWAARKYQIEESRKQPGFGGMAITAIRDTVCTRPGIYDDMGELKWTGRELPRFNAQILPLLGHARENRTYHAEEEVELEFLISYFGDKQLQGNVISSLHRDNEQIAAIRFDNVKVKNQLTTAGKWLVKMPAVDSPTTLRMTCELRVDKWYIDESGHAWTEEDENILAENEWKVWLFPNPGSTPSQAAQVHDPTGKWNNDVLRGIKVPDGVLLSTVLDDKVRQHLASGGSAVIVDASGSAFPSHDTPFWREITVERFDKALFEGFPWQGEIDLPWLGLNTWKAYNLDAQHAPLLRTINCRYLNQNELIISTESHGGKLIATTLNLPGDNHPAGTWLLQQLLEEAK